MCTLKDNYGRAVRYLRLSVTDRCGYRCAYCMAESGGARSGLLSIEELAGIGEAAIRCGVKKIRLTGGEPLMRRGILRLCERLRESAGLEELVLTTNGARLGAMAADLRAAGVGRLNISLDTLRPERFRAVTRRGELDDALRGLDAARAAGFTGTKLNVVLLRGVNDDEIADFAALTRADDLSVRFIELMPVGGSAAFAREHFLPADAVLAAMPELEAVGNDGVAALYRVPGCRGTVGLIRPVTRCFCASCDRIRVTADGKLKPCLHSAEEIPLRGLRGAALEAAIRAGAAAKPARHDLTAGGSAAAREMYAIGG